MDAGCRRIELLAPARDLATGMEAIRHGADAVYIGGPRFGARAAAGNAVEDIRQLVEFARPYGVKVYVTLNTIVYDHELDEVWELVGELERAGVDALIVQDMALLNSKSSIQNLRLKLHASTQMDIRTAEKVEWLGNLGFEQVVLARELTLEEIGAIHEQVPDVRLEVFVHGAVCVSYNGRCYASQYCFGRSANRGECAQFCRMPFDLTDERGRVLMRQKHLLSLRDMNRSDDLEALLDAGVTSLKIEGRLKDVGYVKNVVAYYRQRLDEIFRRRPAYRRSSMGREVVSFVPNPAKSFNRLFTDYFLHGRTPDMANIDTPKSMGEPLGECQIQILSPLRSGSVTPLEMPSAKKGCAPASHFISIQNERLHNGDGLCYINGEGELVGFRVNRVEGDRVYTSLKETERRASLLLYRNHDQEFERQLSRPTATRRVGVRWLLRETEGGFLLRLTREDGTAVEQAFPYPHEQARTSQREQIARQLSRLGDTPYESEGVDIEMSQEWFIPASTLAEWRRELSGKLQERRESGEEVERSSRFKIQDSRLSEAYPLAGRISYLYNVANGTARRFYLDQGAEEVEWAMEVERPRATFGKGLLLMTCRYCIRYELGLCLRNLPGQKSASRLPEHGRGELFLRLSDGRRFRLGFDCRQCRMMVYSED